MGLFSCITNIVHNVQKTVESLTDSSQSQDKNQGKDSKSPKVPMAGPVDVLHDALNLGMDFANKVIPGSPLPHQGSLSSDASKLKSDTETWAESWQSHEKSQGSDSKDPTVPIANGQNLKSDAGKLWTDFTNIFTSSSPVQKIESVLNLPSDAGQLKNEVIDKALSNPILGAPTAFLAYHLGTGQSYKVPFNSVDLKGLKLENIPEFKSKLDEMKKDHKTQDTFDQEVICQDPNGWQNFQYGHLRIQLNGTINIKPDGSWSFDGTATSADHQDPYDFPASPNHRSFLGEVETAFGRYIGGTDYTVYFDNSSEHIQEESAA